MKNPLSFICLISFLTLSFQPFLAGQEPFIVDEAAIASNFEHEMDLAIKTGKIPNGKTLCEQARAANGKNIPLPKTKNRSLPGYDAAKDSVGVLCSVFKCDKCDSWHRGSISTVWAASADGLIVTNMHVVTGAYDKTALGVWFPNGKTYPVIEVVATDLLQDIAVLRIDAKNLKPLSLSAEIPEVGTPISLISHPEGRYYLLTKGNVSRYYKTTYSSTILNDMLKGMQSSTPPTAPQHQPSVNASSGNEAAVRAAAEISSSPERRQTWMNITAEYARGSSGAPILDTRGRVVGMVSSTQSIYSGGRFRPENPGESSPGAFQMCIRNCVPLMSLQNIFKKKQ